MNSSTFSLSVRSQIPIRGCLLGHPLLRLTFSQTSDQTIFLLVHDILFLSYVRLINKCLNIFFNFWLYWVFTAAHGLSLVEASKGHSLLQCVGFSLWVLLCCRAWALGRAGFRDCSTQAQQMQLLDSRADLSSCGFRA